MSINNIISFGLDILLCLFAVCSFFSYFNIFFLRKDKKILEIIGTGIFIIWQMSSYDIVRKFSTQVSICIAIAITIFIVSVIFNGEFWKICFFSVSFDAIWMLMETLSGYVLLIFCERYAASQRIGSFLSKLLLFIVIISLKNVFTNDKIRELPIRYGIMFVFIPIGSMYIMNNIFMLSYRVNGIDAKFYSTIPVIIFLCMNILIFYIYLKLADDFYLRRINSIYEQQLELCVRHQKETEITTLKMRDIRHNMKNNFISILAYAENGECEKIIRFINDMMEEEKIKIFTVTDTGNVVIDSLIGYWYASAKAAGIEFYAKVNIPMQMPFKGADTSLILGNLLENAVEAAQKVEKGKYIKLLLKYNKNNLLIFVENSYRHTLIKTKDNGFKSTKSDAETHGVGLPSVYRTVTKYNGTVVIEDAIPYKFIVKVVLYGN